MNLHENTKANRLFEDKGLLKKYLEQELKRSGISYSFIVSKGTQSIYLTINKEDISISIRISDHPSKKDMRYIYIGNNTKIKTVTNQLKKHLKNLQSKKVKNIIGRMQDE